MLPGLLMCLQGGGLFQFPGLLLVDDLALHVLLPEHLGLQSSHVEVLRVLHLAAPGGKLGLHTVLLLLLHLLENPLLLPPDALGDLPLLLLGPQFGLGLLALGLLLHLLLEDDALVFFLATLDDLLAGKGAFVLILRHLHGLADGSRPAGAIPGDDS